MQLDKTFWSLLNTIDAPRWKFWITGGKRASAAGAIARYGAEAVEALVGCLAGPGAAYATMALEDIGPSALPALIRALSGPGAPYAAIVLKKFGADCVEDLIREFEGEGAPYALLVLKEIGPEAVPHLADSLHHRSAEVRMWAAMTLGDMGRWARDALPELNSALDDPSASVREAASEAIDRIQP